MTLNNCTIVKLPLCRGAGRGYERRLSPHGKSRKVTLRRCISAKIGKMRSSQGRRGRKTSRMSKGPGVGKAWDTEDTAKRPTEWQQCARGRTQAMGPERQRSGRGLDLLPWGDGRDTVIFVSGGSNGILAPAHAGSRKSASQLCSVSSRWQLAVSRGRSIYAVGMSDVVLSREMAVKPLPALPWKNACSS